MSLLTSLMNHPYAELLAWSLVHFLWQGAALALIVLFCFRWLRPGPNARYAIGVLALAAMLAAPVITFVALSPPSATHEEGATLAGPMQGGLKPAPPAVTGASEPRNPGTSEPRNLGFFLIVASWFLGVVFLSIRLLGGWMVARRLVTRAVRPVTPEIHALTRRVAARLALDRVVRVVESSAVSVPVIVGWLKPVVLLPAAALSGLTPTQIEAILAHELAHVRRHDYLVNLLQSIVETLLFYHPGVWWVSRQVRAEREHCCDDLAVRVCDRLVYVTALTDLAAMARTPRLALAATDGSLLRRVRRILGAPGDDGESGSAWLPVLLVAMMVGVILPLELVPARTSAQMAMPADGIGLDQGVRQGVQGGVPGGVPGGVATWSQARTDDPMAEQIRKLEEQAEESRKLAQRLEAERMQLELAQMELQAKARIEEIKTQLELLRKAHDRTKQQWEKGLVGSGQLAEIEAQIAVVEQKLKAAAVEHELQAAAYKLQGRQAEQQREYEERVMSLEMAKQIALTRGEARRNREQETGRASSQSAEEQRLRRDLELIRARLDQLRAAIRTDVDHAIASRDDRLIQESSLVTDESAQVRAGDILTMEIQGEPDLPRAYLVHADGTIKLPLLASIRVQGLTVIQVRQAIAKQLADRRLGASTEIEVSLRRPIRR